MKLFTVAETSWFEVVEVYSLTCNSDCTGWCHQTLFCWLYKMFYFLCGLHCQKICRSNCCCVQGIMLSVFSS